MTELLDEQLDSVQVAPVEADREIPQFCYIENGALVWNFSPGQMQMMNSKKRRVVMVGGTRCGKSSAGPAWMYEKIREGGPGVYLVVAPTFPLLHGAALPNLIDLFQTKLKMGQMRSNPLRFVFSPEGRRKMFAGTKWEDEARNTQTIIRLAHATDPNALEAMTVKAAWLDEAGQDDFKIESWEAVERRLSLHLGPCLITTTPYDSIGWLKTRLVDPWEQSGGDHPDIDVIRLKSIDNPAFPASEYWRQRELMPFWRWDMMYNANFTMPSGLIYDIIKEIEPTHRLPRFEIPQHWPRYVGVDFGGVNTAAIFAAITPSDFMGPKGIIPANSLVFYREYHPAQAMRIKHHADAMLKGEPFIDRWLGGAKSEGQWREEFWENGVNIEEPLISDIEVGIARVYSLMAARRMYFLDDLEKFWRQVYEYRRETDPTTGDVLPEMKIVNQHSYHCLDAVRYLSSFFGEFVSDFIAQGGGERPLIEDYENMENRLNAPHGLRYHTPQTWEGTWVKSGRSKAPTPRRMDAINRIFALGKKKGF